MKPIKVFKLVMVAIAMIAMLGMLTYAVWYRPPVHFYEWLIVIGAYVSILFVWAIFSGLVIIKKDKTC